MRLVRHARQLTLFGTGNARLRDQPLQFRNAGATIGAGLQLHADLGGRARTACDGRENRGAADAEAGADDGAGARQPVNGFADSNIRR